jgi:hypothetical protein
MQVTDPEEVEVEVETETELDTLDGEAGDAGVRIHSPLAIVERGATCTQMCGTRGWVSLLRVRKTRIQTGCP